MNIWEWGGRSSPLDGLLGAVGRLLPGPGAENPQVAPAPEQEPPLRDRPGAGLVRFWWSTAWENPAGYDVERVCTELGIVLHGRRLSKERRWFGIDVSVRQRRWAVHLLDRLGVAWWSSDRERGEGGQAGEMPAAWGSPVAVDRFGRRARRVLGESRYAKRVRRGRR